MRRVYLFGDINNERTEKFIAQLHELFEQGGEPITVYINSCGGSVTDALAIYDVLQNAPCDVYTMGLGKVHSAAVTVLLAAPRENRAVYPNTEFMSHDISWKSDGPRGFLRDRVDQLERTVNQLISIYTRDTDLSFEDAQRLFFSDLAGHYFTPEQAMEMGFVSRIINRESEHKHGVVHADLASVEPRAQVPTEETAAINSSNQT
jgi:ATP-dependent Clp protease protease subunit